MLPTATFKQSPEDFLVEEVDAYPATDDGPHVLVRIRKRGLNTEAALGRIAEALSVDRRACGFAGMKDRDAVAVQRVSLPDVSPERVMELRGRWEDLEILEARRHRNKLKPGHLHGNRFTIVLRDLDPARVDGVVAALEKLGAEGFPNAFGPQRFGRDGDNADRALAFVRGETRPPRDARERRLLFSALQSRWFNRVLEERVADGTWKVPQRGDLLKKHESGGMFLCEDPDTDQARARALELSPTGPMFGPDMTLPAGDILPRELAVLAADGLDLEALARHRALGEGTRRPLRVLIEDLLITRGASDSDGTLTVQMTLGKGVYATTALAQVVTLSQPRPDPRSDSLSDLGTREGTLATQTAPGHRRPAPTLVEGAAVTLENAPPSTPLPSESDGSSEPPSGSDQE